MPILLRFRAAALGLIVAALPFAPASATTLKQALALAYQNNAALNSARAGMRVTHETVPIAKSGMRPTIGAQGQIGHQTQSGIETFTSSFGVSIDQAIFDGFRTANNVRAAEANVDKHEAIGSAWGAAGSSFAFFASGAIIPVIPYLIGLEGLAAVVMAAVLVGVALLVTGAIVGVLSGASPLARALRQLAIGYAAAAATYLLGLAFGATVS